MGVPDKCYVSPVRHALIYSSANAQAYLTQITDIADQGKCQVFGIGTEPGALLCFVLFAGIPFHIPTPGYYIWQWLFLIYTM